MPTIHGERIAFVCEDDVWTVSAGGGDAQRLTAGYGDCTLPRFSPSGDAIAFVGREEGHAECYVIPAAGGPARRMTWFGGDFMWLCGWSADGQEIYLTTDARAPFVQDSHAFAVPLDGGPPRDLGWGHVRTFAVRAGGAVALGRNAHDPARWKRYRGGTAGHVWLDATGGGTFVRVLRELDGNIVWPMWVGGELVVLSDHEGIGNLYACGAQGNEARAITAEQTFYARWPSTDETRVAYTAGAELVVVEPGAEPRRIEVGIPSSAPQAQRRFVDAGEFWENFEPSPDGTALALVARGRVFTMPLWEEAVDEHGGGEAVARRRLVTWLHDGKRVAYVDDAHGYERIAVATLDGSEPPRYLTGDVGRVGELAASPAGERLAFTTHRHDLFVLDADAAPRRIDGSPAGPLRDLAFAPDGRWIAYVVAPRSGTSIVRIASLEDGSVTDATSALRADRSPAWDPEGRYLYLLSTRDFEPVYDALQFELSFPLATRPYALALRRDVPDPFRPKPQALHGKRDDEDRDDDDERERKVEPIAIDRDGLTDRMTPFPVSPANYGRIAGIKHRALFSRYPIKGIPPTHRDDDDDDESGTLLAYDFEEQRLATLAGDVDAFVAGSDGRTIVYASHERLRALDAGGDLPDDELGEEKPPDAPGRRSGWIDLARISLPVDPRAEWAQMYREAWRLQREQFWDEAMSGVDWDAVYARYAALLPRVRTRTELSDLIWEMQGELGTSHAYEWGGDFRTPPPYRRGFLAADTVWDQAASGWRIARILRGDPWNRDADSPLAAPGIDAREGDVIVAVGGRPVDAVTPPDALLVNQANRDVALTLARGDARRRVVVRALRDERMVRYRAWVAEKRAIVHERTGGRVGYVHIPDMGPWGFAEFHRGYLSEFDRDGLIVDVRYNRGGHVSALLLEKLARKRIGYDVSRYFPPMPYPEESIAGPLIAITNQFAGSDGDIFSHCFKIYALGPLVGMRTWGGVIGINPTHELVDGTLTTQPEYSFWFVDAGWGVENYGTDPTHEVDIAPQDALAGRDPQLDVALRLMEEALAKAPSRPTFPPRPHRGR